MPGFDTSQNLLEKIPPQSKDAEMSMLGCMLFEEEALIKAIELLKPDYFYDINHGRIFSAMQNLFEKNYPVDLVTVSEDLRRQKFLEDEIRNILAFLCGFLHQGPILAGSGSATFVEREVALSFGSPQVGLSEFLDELTKLGRAVVDRFRWNWAAF